MSFVNMMANDDWSDADIKNRTEAMIAEQFSPVDYAILLRKVQGQAQGYVLTADDQAQLDRYKQVSFAAGAEADAARADMALLRDVWHAEADDTVVPTPEVRTLMDQRKAAIPPAEVLPDTEAAQPPTVDGGSAQNPPAVPA